jgi:SAM-dependent methyltransferase
MFTAQDRSKCQELFQKYYRGRKFFDTIYRDRIEERVASGMRLLDAGCGRYLTMCKALSGTVEAVGIDLEPALQTDNAAAPFGVRADVTHIPFRSDSFDIVIARSVIEHLEDPAKAFQEFRRVLRPGGTLILVTPNKYDYVSLFAALTPHWFHQKLVSAIFRVCEDDVFPTLYRANTISALRKTIRASGLIEKELDTLNHYPAYLSFSPVLFRLGVLYERVTSLPGFRQLRSSIVCVSQKPGKMTVDQRRPLERLHAGQP